MKASNITISVPYERCSKNCPYCISKMTGYMDTSLTNFYRNLPLAKAFADKCSTTHLLITSKGEPLQNIEDVKKVCLIFDGYPIELQTNGDEFTEDICIELWVHGVKVVSVSVDDPKYFNSGDFYDHIWKMILEPGMIPRATVIITDIFEEWKLVDFIGACNDFGIRQLTFRNPTIPERTVDTLESKKAVKYISDHGDDRHYKSLHQEIMDTVMNGQGNIIMQLPFGPIVYDIQGIGITCMEYCMQEQSNGLNIRNLIYQEDGHLYTCWDKKGSILW